MKLVVDSSVAVKWAVDEEGAGDAMALLDRNEPLCAPAFVLVESANVLWKKSQRDELKPLQAGQALDLVRRAFAELVPDALLLPEALQLSIGLAHPVYDCLYLACAQRMQTRMVTADSRLFNKTRNTRFAPEILLLGDLH